jgi:hypothetical protein
VPLVAFLHERTGDFSTLFWSLAALAAAMFASALCFPAAKTAVHA